MNAGEGDRFQVDTVGQFPSDFSKFILCSECPVDCCEQQEDEEDFVFHDLLFLLRPQFPDFHKKLLFLCVMEKGRFAVTILNKLYVEVFHGQE